MVLVLRNSQPVSDGSRFLIGISKKCKDTNDTKNADRAKTVQKPCKWRIKRKSHEESFDSSWDFGALEGTRIPGPLIKSQMLYRLSYERIFLQ